MKEEILIIDGFDLIYKREVITYEKLCKVIKGKKKIKIIFLVQNIYFKLINTIKEKEIIYIIKNNILGELNKEDYLIHYEKDNKKKLTYIYGIKSNPLIKKIFLDFKNVSILPIQMQIRDLEKKKKNFKYKVNYKELEFFVEVENGFLISSRKERELEEYENKSLKINNEEMKVVNYNEEHKRV